MVVQRHDASMLPILASTAFINLLKHYITKFWENIVNVNIILSLLLCLCISNKFHFICVDRIGVLSFKLDQFLLNLDR